jgi:hypothetical protein
MKTIVSLFAATLGVAMAPPVYAHTNEASEAFIAAEWLDPRDDQAFRTDAGETVLAAEPGAAPAPPAPLPSDAVPAQVPTDWSIVKGGKLLLTNGVSTIEGSSGGGVSTWALIGGRQMERGVGLTGHATLIELPDFGWTSIGASVGIGNRLELSYARQNFDTRDVGAALGIGQGFVLNQDVFGAKLRLFGDVVYGSPWMPQVAIGVQHKRAADAPVALAVGAGSDNGTDLYFSATKLLLAQSLILNGTLRLTNANQTGLLGFGSAADDGLSLQFEGSVGYQLSRRVVIGTEYRTKPDNLGLGENDWLDLFAAYALTDNLTLTAAYVDLGSIATLNGQRGAFVSIQLAF